jgi:hypothetical protein
MHCYGHAALRSHLPPEIVAEGAARTPNLTPFIIAKQRRIEILYRFQFAKTGRRRPRVAG